MKKGKIYILLAILMVSAFAALPANVAATQKENTLYYGVGSLVVDLDPQQAWDSASILTIDQVSEGLFGYNLSDPELAIIPVLATAMGTWNAEATEYTVLLKDGVTFHDGSAFTAADVNYTFARLNNLMDLGETQIAELYEPLADPDNSSIMIQVIDKVVINGPLNVTFKLKYPYVPFVPLLCFSGSVILPEDEYPMDELIDPATGILIGTGSYKYIITTDEYTQLEYYAEWHGDRPDDFIETIMLLYFADGVAKNQALLAGDIDGIAGILPEFLEQYNASEYFELTEIQQGTSIFYMGMNNKRINQTMRQAISYAFDYDYVLEEIGNGMFAKMTSPIPLGIMYHDDTLDYPTRNLTRARTILLDAGLVPAGTDVNESDPAVNQWWKNKAIYDPIAVYNYTWNLGNELRAGVGIITMTNLRDIGINIALTGIAWANYLPLLLGDFDKLELYNVGWGADYNDPSNFINPLFSNTSASNGAQVNDTILQGLMGIGLQETNETARRAIYVEIQRYVVEDLMPWIMMYVRLSPGIQPVAYAGVLRNAMGVIKFATYYWTGEGVPIGIPGYSFIGLIGAATIALGVIYKKRK